MLHQSYHDPIKVNVLFENNRVRPQYFSWGKHQYYIKYILNVYSTHDGRERIYCFSVSNHSDFFKLELHTHNLRWYLVEHYQE